MELANTLNRTPRETLASVTLAEFYAFILLSKDRADEYDEAARGEDGDEPVIDFEEPMAPGAIASIFGARVVEKKANG
jgi:hypothetical protein